ncbi:MAG: HEAT repeat domain-containing protein [Candidatus Zixiibacteriota bacterium]
MDIKELEEKIRAHDWDALDIVDLAADKTKALPVLKELTGDPDAETREIAYNCVALVAGEQALSVIATALRDESEDIRSFALQTLQATDNGPILGELESNLDSEDAAVRGNVALLIGRVDRESASEALRKRLEVEQDEQVQRGIKLALARLGDSEMKDLFASQFDVDDSEVRLKAISDLRYIGDPKLTVRVLPALDDTRQAHLITDKNQPVPKYARVCDAVVNLVAELHNNPFSFEVDGFKIYSQQEIAQVKEFLTKQGAQ